MKRKEDLNYENQLNLPRKTRLRRKTNINYDDEKGKTKIQIQERSLKEFKNFKNESQDQEEIQELLEYFNYFISDLNKLTYEEENIADNNDQDISEGSLNKRSDEYLDENYETDHNLKRKKKRKQYERRKTRKNYLKEKKNRKKSAELEIINEEENKEVNDQVSHQDVIHNNLSPNKVLKTLNEPTQTNPKSFLDIQINEKDENIDNNQIRDNFYPLNPGTIYMVHKNNFFYLHNIIFSNPPKNFNNYQS